MRPLITLLGPYFWKYRHLIDPHWAESYIDPVTIVRPARQLMLRQIETLKPFDSVLEIGCGGGANLHLIHQKYPSADLTGMDISKAALRVAKKFAPYAKFFLGDLIQNDMNLVYKRDVIISDAVLIYISPKHIESVINKLKAWSNKGFVLCEWHGNDSFCDDHYVHNYSKLLPGCNFTKITDWPSDGWAKYGYIITYRK